MDEVFGEKGLSLSEAFLEQTPETAAAHLGPVAGETGDLLAGMLLVWTTDRHLQPHPLAHGGDLPERHAGLGHAERPGIHAEEEDLLRAGSRKATQVGLVRSPSIVQRLVDEVRRRGKRAAFQGLP